MGSAVGSAPLGTNCYAGSAVALRLIAVFKLVKALLLIVVGFTALRLIHADVAAVAATWAERLNLDQNRHIDTLLARLSSLDSRAFVTVGAGSFVYAALLLIEGVGLWLRRRWAEYFTIVFTASFIPLEAYEMKRHFTAVRLAVIVVNVAIVVYLVRRRAHARRTEHLRPVRTSAPADRPRSA
jgi:uncharacterized membrane protein (DUF2068 family)